MKHENAGRTGRKAEPAALPKIKSGIPGFDEISMGGIPKGRATLVSGTSGSGKTVFAAQFLYTGIVDRGENAVFVTFEETPADIMRNVRTFGWDIAGLIRQGKWAFVDASPSDSEEVETGEYDLGALLARIEYAVKKVGAKRIAIDSIAALFARYNDESLVRRELHRVIERLRETGTTTIITAERKTERDEGSRFGVEEFVSDNVIILSNKLDKFGERERSVEILKYRGSAHSTNETPSIITEGGIRVFPKPTQQFEALGFKEK